VSTKPVVVMPQTKNGTASDQKPRERARPRRPIAAGRGRARRGIAHGWSERAADRLEPDVLRAVAQAPPQHGRDDGGEDHGAAEQRRAPARGGHDEQRRRHEQQLPRSEACLDERERQPAPGGEPVRDRDRRRDARRAAEPERRDDAVGQGELPRRLRRGAQRKPDRDDQRADRERAADPEPVDGPADERLRAAVDEERKRPDQGDRPARRAERLLPRPDERAEAQSHALRAQDREEAERENRPGVVATGHGSSDARWSVPASREAPRRRRYLRMR
jgi:hypothetical protein